MDAVEFTQSTCTESPYKGNRVRIEVDRETTEVTITLISPAGLVIDQATFGSQSSAFQMAAWLQYRADW